MQEFSQQLFPSSKDVAGGQFGQLGTEVVGVCGREVDPRRREAKATELAELDRFGAVVAARMNAESSAVLLEPIRVLPAGIGDLDKVA